MKTAVEWLYGKWSEQGILYLEDLGQAKAMEKEQIIDAASDHCYPTCESARFYADEYYNETFKSE